MRDKLRAIVIRHTQRGDVELVASRVSIDDCMNEFRKIAIALVHQRVQGTSTHSRQTTLRFGAEVDVKCDDPPIYGRIDLLTPEGITDFKTGTRKPEHAEQVLFYALLVWLADRWVPPSLILTYVREDVSVSVDVPTPDEFEGMRSSVRAELASLGRETLARAPKAIPSSENCGFCQVRQLCDDYWSSSETAQMRLSRESTQSLGPDDRIWLDAEIVDLPVTASDRALSVSLNTPIAERVRHFIPSGFMPRGGTQFRRARILGAEVRCEPNGLAVVAGANSEVFWIAD